MSPAATRPSIATPWVEDMTRTREAPGSLVREAFVNPNYGPAPESDHFANEWLRGGERSFGHYIGGRWTGGEGAVRETRCPADGQLLATFRYGTEDDVNRAVAAARAALPGWQELGGHGRARHLYRLARQLQKRSRLFSVVESLDNGKPVRESRDLDIPLAARHFYHHAGWAQLLPAEFPGTNPSAWSARSSPGTSRSSCWRGRWRPLWRPGTRWFSSPPSTRRSPRSSSPSWRTRPAFPRRAQHRDGGRRDRGGSGTPPGCRQGGIHRLHRGGDGRSAG